MTMQSAISVRPRTSSTLISKAFMSASASITTVLSDGDLTILLLGLRAALVWLAARGVTTAFLRSLVLRIGVFFLTGTTLSVVWSNNGYPGSVYALGPA